MSLMLVILIVIILALAYYIHVTLFWRGDDGISYVYGHGGGHVSSDTSNIQTLQATDGASCRSLCGEQDWCNAYTYLKRADDAAGTCYGFGEVTKRTLDGEASSAMKVKGFGPKLIHLMGMEGAGAKSESITAPRNLRK